MPPANMETDPFFVLLTDALRAGPGSSQWQEAVTSLRERGLEGSDEHRLLIETRENLEAGRDYRAVRAGPGFTRKVMAEIESGAAGVKPKGIPTATIVALLSGVLILSAIGYVVFKMSSTTLTGQALIDDLETKSQGFVDKVASASFNGTIPDGWHAIGSLKLNPGDGLHPEMTPEQEGKTAGGGVVLNNALPGTQPFAVDVSIHAPAPTAALLLEAFVTTDGAFSPDKGTSSHDLVWQLRDKGQQVLVNGSGQIADAPPAYHPGDGIRLIVGKDIAIIETIPASGKPQRLWAGPHGLGAGARYVGVRFLQTGTAGKPDVSVQQIKVSTAAGS